MQTTTKAKAISGLKPEAIVQSIESNLVDSSAVLGRNEDGVVFRGDDITWVYTGQPCLSRVLQARFTPEEADDRVQEILNYFKEWDSAVCWIVGPSSWPLTLPEHLRKNGFGTGEIWMGMAMDLSTLGPKPEAPADLRIEKVIDPTGLKIWAMLGAEGQSVSEANGAVQLFAPENAGGDKRCRYYVAYLGAEPVARGMSFTKEDAVGLYWLTTIPQHRGKGISAAIAHRALQDEGSAGARFAVMPALPSGRALCRRIGFSPYCQFTVYNWPPSPLSMHYC